MDQIEECAIACVEREYVVDVRSEGLYFKFECVGFWLAQRAVNLCLELCSNKSIRIEVNEASGG